MDIIRSGRPQISRLEIVEKGRRRHFSDEAKLAIVAESYSGPQQVSATARRHESERDEHTTLPVGWVDAGGRVVTGPVL